ncbi:hypothetical protein [Candidatus Bartonella washoeensis]|uniref:hypothetical protein n=1 Tax=Candidatus Bartonella washoeensis TaxID=186739 RepID=UPI001AEC55E3
MAFFPFLAAMIQERSFFDQVEQDKILKGVQCAIVALCGLKRIAKFSVISINVCGLGKAFLLDLLGKKIFLLLLVWMAQ